MPESKYQRSSRETIEAKNRTPLQDRSDSFALDNHVQERERSPK